MQLQENTLFAQYPLPHVTYAPAKFEVAISNSLGEDAFTKKNIILYPFSFFRKKGYNNFVSKLVPCLSVCPSVCASGCQVS